MGSYINFVLQFFIVFNPPPPLKRNVINVPSLCLKQNRWLSFLFSAVKEAKEISKYLKPLEKTLNKLDSVDFNEADPNLRTLLHIVCLVWANCKYYCSSAKVTHLLQLIANQLIDMVRYVFRLCNIRYQNTWSLKLN